MRVKKRGSQNTHRMMVVVSDRYQSHCEEYTEEEGEDFFLDLSALSFLLYPAKQMTSSVHFVSFILRLFRVILFLVFVCRDSLFFYREDDSGEVSLKKSV